MARYPGAEEFRYDLEFIEKLHWSRFVQWWGISVAVERMVDCDEMWSYHLYSVFNLKVDR